MLEITLKEKVEIKNTGTATSYDQFTVQWSWQKYLPFSETNLVHQELEQIQPPDDIFLMVFWNIIIMEIT